MYHKFSCTINLNNFIGYVSDVKNGKKKSNYLLKHFAKTFIQYWEIRRFPKEDDVSYNMIFLYLLLKYCKTNIDISKMLYTF